MIIGKRYGEQYDIREFIEPSTYMVRDLASRLSGHGDFASSCWDWVKSNVQYPLGSFSMLDVHTLKAFGVIQRTTDDLWQFPSETLALRMGDCEDAAILLCSLMRTQIPETQVLVTVGTYNGYGHAWVWYNGLVLETSPGGPPAPEKEVFPYRADFRFNDKLIVEAAASGPVPSGFLRLLTGR